MSVAAGSEPATFCWRTTAPRLHKGPNVLQRLYFRKKHQDLNCRKWSVRSTAWSQNLVQRRQQQLQLQEAAAQTAHLRGAAPHHLAHALQVSEALLALPVSADTSGQSAARVRDGSARRVCCPLLDAEHSPLLTRDVDAHRRQGLQRLRDQTPEVFHDELQRRGAGLDVAEDTNTIRLKTLSTFVRFSPGVNV